MTCFHSKISVAYCLLVKGRAHVYGRMGKMMTGLLSLRGIHISQQRAGELLSRVSPAYQEARRTATAH